MEYTVPAEYGPQCLREILHKIKKDNIPVIFPIEARYVKGDDFWLSPFYKRDGFAISCHNFHDKDYKDRKSTRLNSSHVRTSYAAFCLKKKRHVLADAGANPVR